MPQKTEHIFFERRLPLEDPCLKGRHLQPECYGSSCDLLGGGRLKWMQGGFYLGVFTPHEVIQCKNQGLTRPFLGFWCLYGQLFLFFASLLAVIVFQDHAVSYVPLHDPGRSQVSFAIAQALLVSTLPRNRAGTKKAWHPVALDPAL